MLYFVLYLHSTIFILKQEENTISEEMTIFTFYYIYIKTSNDFLESLKLNIYLHSTIFILKRNK